MCFLKTQNKLLQRKRLHTALYSSFLQLPQRQPVHGHENHRQPRKQIHQARCRQPRVRSRKPTVKQNAEKSCKAQVVNHPKRAYADPLAQIKRDGDQNGEVRSQNTDANPKRAILGNERHKELRKIERHVVFAQQNENMHNRKHQREQSKIFVSVICKRARHQPVKHF